MFTAILATLLPKVGEVIDKLVPDRTKAAEMKQQMELAMMAQQDKVMDILAKSDEGQAAIDLEDAKSESWIKSMWRPILCWTCVLGFMWACLIQPITLWYLALKHLTVVMPAFPENVLNDMLWGLLGMGAYRTIQAHPSFSNSKN